MSFAVSVLALFALATGWTSGPAGKKPFKPSGQHPAYVAGEVLVKYKQGAASAFAEQRLALQSIQRFRTLGMNRLRVPGNVSVEQAVAELEKDPDVEFAEPNYIAHISQVTPNDPLFSQQWALPKISAPQAWEKTEGSTGIIVAVLDTGIDYGHPDLGGNVLLPGADFVNPGSAPLDDNGHGTHVAGIIGAVTDNGIGVAGTMWNVKLLPIKVFGADGTGDVATIVQGIDYAKSQGAVIVNCSFALDSGVISQTLQNAIASAPNMLFVCAAGNESNNNDTKPTSPASIQANNVIAVASTDFSDNLSSFSNYGAKTVQIAAPGGTLGSNTLHDIVSTFPPPRPAFYSENFSTPGGWTLGSGWALTTAFFNSPPSSIGIAPGGQADSSATSPAITATGGQLACSVDFKLRLNTDAVGHPSDALFVESSTDNATWTTLNSYNGSFDDFADPAAIESTSLGDGKNPVYVRFRFHTSTSGEYAYVDDVAVACASKTYDPAADYAFEAGTSMSAPFASGAAGLLKTEFPNLTPGGMKTLLMSGVDVLSSLSGKVSTSGRLNINNSFLPPTPAGFAVSSTTTSRINLLWKDDPNEDSYQLEREQPGGTFSPIATLAANTTSYSDTELAKDTTYTYRIKAVNAFGPSQYATLTATASGGSGGGGGGCFIATAAFGSPLSKEVTVLRDFRDRVLLKSSWGTAFVAFYYAHSPAVADVIRQHDALRFFTRMLLYPVVWLVKYPYLFGLLPLGLGIIILKIVKYSSNGSSRK